MANHKDLPCGRCDAGVYDAHPFLVGIEMFRGCLTSKDALKSAPLCKSDETHICFGARDFITCFDFPITVDDVVRFRSDIGVPAGLVVEAAE